MQHPCSSNNLKYCSTMHRLALLVLQGLCYVCIVAWVESCIIWTLKEIARRSKWYFCTVKLAALKRKHYILQERQEIESISNGRVSRFLAQKLLQIFKSCIEKANTTIPQKVRWILKNIWIWCKENEQIDFFSLSLITMMLIPAG